MAVLTEQDRFDTWAEVMRVGADFGQVTITKQDLRAAVNAVDQFLSDNAAALNAAIPQPARGSLTAAQKAFIVEMIARKRRLKGA